MNSDNRFFKILDEGMLNCFDREAGKVVERTPGITGSKAYACITKRHESGRIKGFAEKYSGKIKKNITEGKLARKSKYNIRPFETALKQAASQLKMKQSTWV